VSTAGTDARWAAALACLTRNDARAAALGADLGADLAAALTFLAPLRHVRLDAGGGAVGVGAGGMPLRADEGPAYAMARPLRTIAPATRAGFILVPRLAAGPHRDVASDAGQGTGVLDTDTSGAGVGRTGIAGGGHLGDDVLGDDALAAEMELGA